MEKQSVDRAALTERLREDATWDVLIIGGGATGLGAAVDAAARGFRTLLVEASDFGKGTSSRSTKLVHGGVRYLQQGNVSLVLEALRERGRLLRNAPHLVYKQAFVVPCYKWWERYYYGIGLKMYDLLAGRLGFGHSVLLSREETIERLPTIRKEGLSGGVLYYDGGFDDSRLAVNLAQTATDLGGVTVNYACVVRLLKENGRVTGAVVREEESGIETSVRARSVVNATGAFADGVRKMDNPDATPIIQPSQGIHLVLDASFLPGGYAIMLPRTDDGRVLFAVPWHGRAVVGTTDTPVERVELEPPPMPEEIEFLLAHAGRYLSKKPKREDVLSVFTGLRPLVGSDEAGSTASISRDHHLDVSSSGLITITGGKWTTYRPMGADAIDAAIRVGSLEKRETRTESLPIHGHTEVERTADPMFAYGSDAEAVRRLSEELPDGNLPLHPHLPYMNGEVVWAARHEMARTVDDVLARRTRSLLLDARAAIEAAPSVAAILAEELGRDATWAAAQVADFEAIAANYLLEPARVPSPQQTVHS